MSDSNEAINSQEQESANIGATHGVMLRVERVLSSNEAYYVVWGGRRASRDLPTVRQAYAVMWSILRVLFVESDIVFSADAMKTDVGFTKTMISIVEEVMKTDGLRPTFKEYLKEEHAYWQNEAKILEQDTRKENLEKEEDKEDKKQDKKQDKKEDNAA